MLLKEGSPMLLQDIARIKTNGYTSMLGWHETIGVFKCDECGHEEMSILNLDPGSTHEIAGFRDLCSDCCEKGVYPFYE